MTMKQQIESVRKYARGMRSDAPFIALLFTIAILAITSAVYIVKYTSARSYQRKWQDYDDCGLA